MKVFQTTGTVNIVTWLAVGICLIGTYLLGCSLGMHRLGQTLGLPLLALLCMAVVKWYSETNKKSIRVGLPLTLPLLVGLEGFALHSIANAKPTTAPVQQKKQEVTPKSDGSEASLRQALKQNPADIQSRYQLARLLEKSGKDGEATVEFERLLNINDKEPDPHFAYGALLAKMGRKDKAAEHLHKALELYPKDSPWRQNVQEALDTLKEPSR